MCCLGKRETYCYCNSQSELLGYEFLDTHFTNSDTLHVIRLNIRKKSAVTQGIIYSILCQIRWLGTIAAMTWFAGSVLLSTYRQKSHCERAGQHVVISRFFYAVMLPVELRLSCIRYTWIVFNDNLITSPVHVFTSSSSGRQISLNILHTAAVLNFYVMHLRKHRMRHSKRKRSRVFRLMSKEELCSSLDRGKAAEEVRCFTLLHFQFLIDREN